VLSASDRWIGVVQLAIEARNASCYCLAHRAEPEQPDGRAGQAEPVERGAPAAETLRADESVSFADPSGCRQQERDGELGGGQWVIRTRGRGTFALRSDQGWSGADVVSQALNAPVWLDQLDASSHWCESSRMEIRFLGSGDAFGSGGRFQTCIRLQENGYTTLVDCGATSLTAMKAQHLDPGEVDAVVLTHLHGDHFGGLPFLVLDGQFTSRTKALTVLGPVGTADRLNAVMEAFYPGSTSVQRRFDLNVIELDWAGSAQRTGALTVHSWEVDHASGAPALAVRAQLGGATLAYSGDTAWTPTLITAAEGSDVFVCEAYTYDKPVRYHLDYATLRKHAGELSTKQLILTHMGLSMLTRLDELDHLPACDGLVLRT